MQKIIAISGVKNSGKTTLCESLIQIFSKKGYRVAGIKHDGHDFEADVAGTDSYRHFHAGAYGTAVFSSGKVSMVKRETMDETAVIALFPKADIVLMEGFKDSVYPKIELVRKGNSTKPVCEKNVIGIASDIPGMGNLDLNEPEQIAEYLLDYLWKQEKEEALSCVILAGGKSSRMGEDKAELLWRGKRFLDLQIEKAEALGIKDILVSGYRGKDCAYPVIPDIYAERGPLGGMHACLRQAKNEHCLVLGIVVPRLPVGELQRLKRLHLCGEQEATLLIHRQKIEPLIGIYRKMSAEQIEKILQKGTASVQAFLKTQTVAYLEYRGEEELLFNCNRREDYERLP